MTTNKYKVGDLLVSVDYKGNDVKGFTYLIVEITDTEYTTLISYAEDERTEFYTWDREVFEQSCCISSKRKLYGSFD